MAMPNDKRRSWSSMHTKFTRVAFASSGASIDVSDPTNHRIVATADMSRGHLIVLEQVAHAYGGVLHSMLREDPKWRAELTPRRADDDKADTTFTAIKNKLQYNGWGTDAPYSTVLACAAAKFNHDDSPNCGMFMSHMPVDLDGEFEVHTFAAAVTVRPVKAGEELCISYGQHPDERKNVQSCVGGAYVDPAKLPENADLQAVAERFGHKYIAKSTDAFKAVMHEQARAAKLYGPVVNGDAVRAWMLSPTIVGPHSAAARWHVSREAFEKTESANTNTRNVRITTPAV